MVVLGDKDFEEVIRSPDYSFLHDIQTLIIEAPERLGLQLSGKALS